MPCGHFDSRTNGVGIPRMGRLGQGARTQPLHVGLQEERVSKWRDSAKQKTNHKLYPHFQIMKFFWAVSAQGYSFYTLEKSRILS